MEKEKQLTKEELEKVNGGYFLYGGDDGKYYQFVGKKSQRDQKYVCPNCGRPVHYGSSWRYYCDHCNESWWYEKLLEPNFKSGLWEEIDYEDFEELSYCGSEFIDD